MTDFSNIRLPQFLVRVSQDIVDAGGRPLLVGGWVRDHLLGLNSEDYDIEVYGLELELLMRLLSRHGKPNLVGRSFGVITMRAEGKQFDFAFPRTESKVGQGHKGFMVKPDPRLTFAEAASRRDFTINAMGLELPGLLLEDPHGGRRDLEARVLRHVSEAFSEDPLRALRAVQFAARFELDIAPATQLLCRVQPLEELSTERVYAELKKLLLKSERPSVGLEWMRAMGMLRFFPELLALVGVPQEPEWHPEGDVWVHTCMVVDQAAALRGEEPSEGGQMTLMLGALCHDLGKPATTIYDRGRWRSPGHDALGEEPTRRFLERLTQEQELIETVVLFVKDHLRPALLHKARDEITPSAIRRLALRVDIPKLLRVAKADHWGRTTEEALRKEFPAGEWLLEQSEKLDVLHERPRPLLTGKYLLSQGMKPGPQVGELIRESFELQLEGHLKSREEVESWARKILGIP